MKIDSLKETYLQTLSHNHRNDHLQPKFFEFLPFSWVTLQRSHGVTIVSMGYIYLSALLLTELQCHPKMYKQAISVFKHILKHF